MTIILSTFGQRFHSGAPSHFAAVATVFSFVVAAIQGRLAKNTESPLLEVEVENWTLDGFSNTGVRLAFLIAGALGDTRWAYLVSYVDPVLLTPLVLVLVWAPLKTVVENVSELWQVVPQADVQTDIRERFDNWVLNVPKPLFERQLHRPLGVDLGRIEDR